MSKISLEFNNPKSVKISHNETEIELKPFLSLGEQVFIINAYIREYFYSADHSVIDGVDTKYFEAEYVLRTGVFQFCTNIKTKGIDNEVYSDSVLWKKITSEITNYDEFMEKLNYIVKEVREQNALKQSIGSVVSGLITKGYEILDKFSNISPDEMKKAIEEGKILIKKLEESSVLGTNFVTPPNDEKK